MMHFNDCPNCQKRVRQAATRCHRCGFRLLEPDQNSGAPEHSEGGYDQSQDDFDYDEYLEKEFESKPPIRKLWVYVTWILLFAILFPVFLQILAAVRAD